MPPLLSKLLPTSPRDKNRRRKWFFVAIAMSTQIGCIRFRNDAAADGGSGAETTPDSAPPENDGGTDGGGTLAEGGDAVVIPPPVCDGYDSNIAGRIAGDLISVLLIDCRLRRHFNSLPPIAVTHLQECLTAQVGQVMGCKHPDGEPFKYPTFDSKGNFCRDMKSSHMALNSSDGDFDAFISDLNKALEQNGLTMEERVRVATVFGATRNDIVYQKDAGPTLPCDAPDAT
jgi:hypothetical protein